jgi:sigma-B regulation protein RsbU (phosphoserine phosphatase)
MLDLKDRALAVANEGITIVDARLPDMPLIYVNEGFERLTGYSASDVLGRNCRFLQGPESDPETAEQIRVAIREERSCLVEILNYRRDGSTFWNRLSITPIRDAMGTVTHFIGVQSNVTERRRAENALAEANRRMRFYLDAAARIQQSLLPDRSPDLPGVEMAWTFRPCSDLAGDTFNFLSLGEGLVGFYIIDVSGHGVPAALLSVTLSHNLSPVSGRSWLLGPEVSPDTTRAATPPAEVVSRLNQSFQMLPGRSQYFTMIYGIIEPVGPRLRYAAAGHPPIVLVPQNGDARTLPTGGIPVGMLEEASWYEMQEEVSPGDRLYFYTDGVIEAAGEGRSEFGIDRLVNELGGHRKLSLQASVDTIRSQIEGWCGDKDPGDDVTILAVEVNPR